MNLPTLQMSDLSKRLQPSQSAFRSFGIYAIQNNLTKRLYIGYTAKSFIRRWRIHRVELRMGRHSRPELQADWAAYGESIFTCAIFEIVTSVDGLAAREEWYIRATARDVGIKQLYNSLDKLRNARDEFHDPHLEITALRAKVARLEAALSIARARLVDRS